MNILTLASLLQATAPAGAGQQPQAGGGGMFWIMIIAMFVIMWLFMIRPQRKQQKALEEMRRSLKKGDKVVTAGGIYGVVADVDDRTVLVKVDGEVKLRVDKSSIQKDMSDQAPVQPQQKK